MLKKYKNKKLVFILDNLWAHKSSLIIDIVKRKPKINLLLTPSNTPQYDLVEVFLFIFFRFSPIENMFGHIKQSMKDFEFPNKTKNKPEKLVFEILKVIYGIKRYTFEGFFKKTFLNMKQFWLKFKR